MATLSFRDGDNTRYQTTLAFAHHEQAHLESQADAFLHPCEIRALASYSYAKKRHSFLLGRYASKKALEAQFQIPVKEIQVDNTYAGKPYSPDFPCEVSISHTGNYGLAMVGQSNFPFAIDIEKCHQSINFPEGVFSLEELTLYNECNSNELKLLLWSAKEALVKLLQIGLTVDMSILEASKIERMDANKFCVHFKRFHALKVFVFKLDSLVLSVCIGKNISLSKVIEEETPSKIDF